MRIGEQEAASLGKAAVPADRRQVLGTMNLFHGEGEAPAEPKYLPADRLEKEVWPRRESPTFEKRFIVPMNLPRVGWNGRLARLRSLLFAHPLDRPGPRRARRTPQQAGGLLHPESDRRCRRTGGTCSTASGAATHSTDFPPVDFGVCICLARSRRFCVAQVSKPAVSPTSKSAPCIAASGFGNPRHSRLGSLRYAKHILASRQNHVRG
jgi:hypothetical protein